MADGSKIEWTDATWNPITGCSLVSEGCRNCYAMCLAAGRLRNHPSRVGLTNAQGKWNGEVRFNEQWLDQPLRWRKPRMVFVCAHSDLFHENVPDEWIHAVFDVMEDAQRHTFQVLTKRPERARDYLRTHRLWPVPNVWIGTSVEDQKAADERLPILVSTPAAVRWVSAEPLLGRVVLAPYLHAIDWVVVGGESGPGARPMDPEWVRLICGSCLGTGTPFFFKQWGEWRRLSDVAGAWHNTTKIGRDGEIRGRFQGRLTSGSDELFGGRSFETMDVATGRETYVRLGKELAGREFDGRTWDEYPEVRR